MLFSHNEASGYIRQLEKYLESDDSKYSKVMAEHLISFLGEARTLMLSEKSMAVFKEVKSSVVSLLGSSILTLDLVEHAHFECARLLRVLSFGEKYDFNQHDIVQFYLRRSFCEVAQKKVDLIAFGVPEMLVLDKIEQKKNEINSFYVQVEEWDDKQKKREDVVQRSIENWTERLSASESRYRGILEDHNYLGLANAFDGIIKNKTKEAASLRAFMVGLAVLSLVIPVVQLLWGLRVGGFSDIKMPVLSTAFFSVAAEVILIYYFRLCHIRWVNVKNQIAQLELRHAMCAFVQDYADKTKELERDTLTKFENMIFTDVSSDSAPPPSIYDAVDSIAKLLAAWKKPGA